MTPTGNVWVCRSCGGTEVMLDPNVPYDRAALPQMDARPVSMCCYCGESWTTTYRRAFDDAEMPPFARVYS